jgi:hypothetical protein
MIQVFRAKPNPFGKDKTASGTPKPEQLLGEWVDLKNVGTSPVRLSSIQLYHTTFNSSCQPTGQPERYWSGSNSDTLKPGEVVRIHTGRRRDERLMAAEDKGAVQWRAFAERDNFVLNNRCGDKLVVTWLDSSGTRRDEAAYDPKPPEGAVLVRAGNKLIQSVQASRF